MPCSSHPVADMAAHARAHEPRQAVLLLGGQRGVERRGRVGHLLHRLAARDLHVGAPLHAFDRILRPLVARLVHRLAHSLHHVAHGALERRPEFLLLGVQAEPGMDRSDPRVEERGAVLRGKSTIAPARAVAGSHAARPHAAGPHAAGTHARSARAWFCSAGRPGRVLRLGLRVGDGDGAGDAERGGKRECGRLDQFHDGVSCARISLLLSGIAQKQKADRFQNVERAFRENPACSFPPARSGVYRRSKTRNGRAFKLSFCNVFADAPRDAVLRRHVAQRGRFRSSVRPFRENRRPLFAVRYTPSSSPLIATFMSSGRGIEMML